MAYQAHDRSIQWEHGTDHASIKYNQELLEEPLNVRNYKKKFHQLLTREKEVHVELLKERYSYMYMYIFNFIPSGVMEVIPFMCCQIIFSINLEVRSEGMALSRLIILMMIR